MIYQEERAIAQAIKDKSLRCPALIYGSEEYLKQQVCSRLTKSANEAFSSFNDFRFDFEQLDLQGLSDVLSAPPMMADWRTVLVYNVDPKGFGAELYKQLEGLLGQVYEDCRVVFLEKSGCFDDKRDEKSKKVIKLFDKLGSVLHLKERTEGDLQKLIKSEAQQGGCTIVPAAAKQLLASCGRDIMALKSEVQKLCAYKNWEGEITPEDVGLLTVQKAEDNIYGLSRAILRDDYDLAMKILGDLCYLRYPTEASWAPCRKILSTSTGRGSPHRRANAPPRSPPTLATASAPSRLTTLCGTKGSSPTGTLIMRSRPCPGRISALNPPNATGVRCSSRR